MSEEVNAEKILYEGASSEDAKKFIETMDKKKKYGYALSPTETEALGHARIIVSASQPSEKLKEAKQELEKTKTELEATTGKLESARALSAIHGEAAKQQRIALKTRGISDEKVTELTTPLEEKIRKAEAKVGAKKPGTIVFDYSSGEEEKWEVFPNGTKRKLDKKGTILEGVRYYPEGE